MLLDVIVGAVPSLSLPGLPRTFSLWSRNQKKYASTGGWGLGHFNERDGKKPGDAALLKTCFPCHQKAKESDLVFTRYAP